MIVVTCVIITDSPTRIHRPNAIAVVYPTLCNYTFNND